MTSALKVTVSVSPENVMTTIHVLTSGVILKLENASNRL